MAEVTVAELIALLQQLERPTAPVWLDCGEHLEPAQYVDIDDERVVLSS